MVFEDALPLFGKDNKRVRINKTMAEAMKERVTGYFFFKLANSFAMIYPDKLYYQLFGVINGN